VGAWYPITPSTSLMDAFKGFCERYRVDPVTGELNFAVIQAEDELAAIGMVVGASWKRRASLYADQRTGHFPDERVRRAGVLCRGALRDFRRAAGRPVHRHADAHAAIRHHAVRLCLARRHAPRALVSGDPEECFYMACRRSIGGTPANAGIRAVRPGHRNDDWMCRDLQWDDAYRPDRGKVLSAEELAGLEQFYRYVDRDDDRSAIARCPA